MHAAKISRRGQSASRWGRLLPSRPDPKRKTCPKASGQVFTHIGVNPSNHAYSLKTEGIRYSQSKEIIAATSVIEGGGPFEPDSDIDIVLWGQF